MARRTMIGGLATLAMAAGGSVAGTAGAASPADEGAPIKTMMDAYREARPEITPAAARAAAEQADERKVVTSTISIRYAKMFGGAWFDAPAGVLHLALTSAEATDRARTLAREQRVRIRTHSVERSLVVLQRQADKIRRGDGPLSEASNGQVGIDIKTNRVVVAVPEDQVERLRPGGRRAGVTVVADPEHEVEADACSGRDVCDGSIAAGAMLWRGSVGSFVCSAGFTAEDPFVLTRFLYTAGHCSNGNGVDWGTGVEDIGPMVGSLDLNDIDASIIQVTNPLFTGQPGGRLYNTDDVDAVAPTLGSIVIDDVVCKAANFQDPTGSRFCGTIGSISDPAVRGMVRVDNEDACSGDSGGTWYELVGNTRTGYGIHSRSDTGCRGDAGGTQSWFSALPTVKAGLAPGYNVETR